MSNPFARAVDLSALKRPAAPTGPAGGPVPGGAAPGSPYAVEVSEANFQALLEQSMAGPVLLVMYSPSRMPASAALADDLTTLMGEFEGRYLLGRVDVDAQPAIAEMLQVPSVPLVAAVLQGRLQPLFQSTLPVEELRAMLTQLAQSLAAQGMSGRHQPLPAGATGDEADEGGEAPLDPRYAPAEDALMAGDLDTAIEEYDKLVAANPADSEAAVGLARAKLMKRTLQVDLATAREAAAAAPMDVDAQILVADLDLLGGHVDDAFDRLVETVRRTSDKDRDKVRAHLIELFAVVGDDPRVARARQRLASALF